MRGKFLIGCFDYFIFDVECLGESGDDHYPDSSEALQRKGYQHTASANKRSVFDLRTNQKLSSRRCVP